MWHRRDNAHRVDPGDRAFWSNLWESDPIRELMTDPRHGYAALLDKAAAQPWWLYPIEQPYERRHFSVWFGQAIAQRTYANPVIHDLYILHDMLHGLTFVDDPTSTETAWRERMRSNEILVSLETEALIYHRVPSLRAVSFDHPIAVDQWSDPSARALLNERLRRHEAALRADPAEIALAAARPAHWPLPHPVTAPWSAEDLWWQRRMITHHPDTGVVWEHWITRYEDESRRFYDAWAPHWREVETERAAFNALCAQGDWKEAVRRREQQWERRADANGVPYGDTARTAIQMC